MPEITITIMGQTKTFKTEQEARSYCEKEMANCAPDSYEYKRYERVIKWLTYTSIEG